MRLYPLGDQDFQKLREKGKVYIDKTEYIWNMTHCGADYIFLSRPRRFGKTLLVSTLMYYFQGRKDLFEGLFISEKEKDWEEYPVIRFDLSQLKGLTKDELYSSLSLKILEYEDLYGKVEEEKNLGDRIVGIIKRAYDKTGKKVVLLIDEYDAPLLEVVHEEENLKDMRRMMRNFYSPMKSCDPYFRFVFFTGITKFSQLSIFSELNNIKNIGMLPEYAGICGITKTELTGQMAEDIDLLAQKRRLTSEETLARLVRNYDGYHFTWPSDDIFNPYSLLNTFADGIFGKMWFETATPTALIEMMRKYKVMPSDIGSVKVKESGFNVPIETAANHVPLFYQSGYLTIKDYNERRGIYTLDIPNREVREGLMDSLMTSYVADEALKNKDMVIANIQDALEADDTEAMLMLLRDYFATIPHTSHINHEGHYQQLIYIMLTLAGAEAQLEVNTARGTIDIAAKTPTRIYVIETKLNKSASAAMRQIEQKDYASLYANSGLPVTKIGVNFDSETRTIKDWMIM